MIAAAEWRCRCRVVRRPAAVRGRDAQQAAPGLDYYIAIIFILLIVLPLYS